MIVRTRPSISCLSWTWFTAACAIVLLAVASGCARELKQQNAALMTEVEQLRADIATMADEIDALRRGPAYLYAQANQIKQQRKYRDARSAFTDLIALHPDGPEAQEARDRIAEIDQKLQDIARQVREWDEQSKTRKDDLEPDPLEDMSCG